MMQIPVLLLFLYLLLVFGNDISERLDFGAGIPNPAWFYEGVTLELHCRQETTIDIEIASPSEIIVKGSTLVDGTTHKYDFQKNSTTSVLVIKKLSRNDQGIYTCQGQDRGFALIHVVFSPSDESPLCTSNYDSPVIFNDLRQDYIIFTCITEEGNPPVLMTLNIFKLNHTANITDIAKICSYHQQFDYNRSFSCVLNESLENTSFVCTISQQFPSHYNVKYEGSCSFGPLHFLPKFSISISPSDVTVNEGESVTLTCTSTLSGVEPEWIDIPEGWKYNVTKSEYSSHLEIYNVTQQSTSEIIVQCTGSYGNQSRSDTSKISIFVGVKGRVAAIVVTVCVLLFIFCIILAVCYYVRKRRLSSTSLSSDHQRSKQNEVHNIQMNTTPSTSNTNNANNKAIEVCDEDERSNLHPSNDQLKVEEVSDMCNNPIYEPA